MWYKKLDKIVNFINFIFILRIFNKIFVKNLNSNNIITNKTTVETRYYISNLPCNIIEFSNAIRKEWSIENKLHWHLDLTFKEDNNKTFEKNAQKNLNIIRKFCLSILKLVKDIYGLSLKNIRKYLCMDFENEIEKIFTYLNPEKVKELVDSTNSQYLWFYPDFPLGMWNEIYFILFLSLFCFLFITTDHLYHVVIISKIYCEENLLFFTEN